MLAINAGQVLAVLQKAVQKYFATNQEQGDTSDNVAWEFKISQWDLQNKRQYSS